MAELDKALSVDFEGIQTLLHEAHETIEAIREGAVDAFVMHGTNGDEVFILKGANRPYRLFVEQMNDGAVTLSKDGIVLYANKYFTDLLKTPLEQIIGAPFESFFVKKELLRPVLQENSVGNLEMELLARDGATRPVYISYSPLRSGESSWICIIVMDVSEQKQQQALLQESQRLAEIGRTAAVLSHEIANPLSSMDITVQVMQRQIAGLEVGHVFNEPLQLLREAISGLATLLNDFRSLSHPPELDLLPTDVATLVAETVKLIPAEGMDTNVHIEKRFSADLPVLNLDRKKIKQVFLNLYKNAVEAMPSGGKLTIDTRFDGNNVVIEIRDTGVGISEEIDIFDFFTTTKSEGTGLGLAVVRQIVAAHGGTINYVSRPNEGTSFFVSLPSVLPRL